MIAIDLGIEVGDYITVYHSGGLVTSGEVIEITDSIVKVKYEFGEMRGRRFSICEAESLIFIENINSLSKIKGV